MREFFTATAKDPDATWPYKMDKHRGYEENRLITGIKLANPKPLIVPILRAGLGMVDGILDLVPAGSPHGFRIDFFGDTIENCIQPFYFLLRPIEIFAFFHCFNTRENRI